MLNFVSLLQSSIQIQREVKGRAMPPKRRKGQCPQTPSKTVAIANNGRHYRENRRVKLFYKGKNFSLSNQLSIFPLSQCYLSCVCYTQMKTTLIKQYYLFLHRSLRFLFNTHRQIYFVEWIQGKLYTGGRYSTAFAMVKK